ncbi:MAG: DciA family protein [Pseudomonadota bacterium]
MKSLDHHFRHIARPAFEQYGFAHGDLVAQWTAIVGDQVAAQCSPERMVWPKGRDKAQRHTEGATLTVRADHGAGLALSYETPAIIDRINGFFGYNAVAKIKIVQGARAGNGKHKSREVAVPTPEVIEHVAQKTGSIENQDLKAALTRLGGAALADAAAKAKQAR